MSKFVSTKALKAIRSRTKNKKFRFLVMGVAFKENCSDTRNSKIIDTINILKDKKHYVEIFDPIINKKELYKNTNLTTISKPKSTFYDCIIIAASHKVFHKIGINVIRKFLKPKGIVFDVKNMFNRNLTDLNL